jgi:hypothetical protein
MTDEPKAKLNATNPQVLREMAAAVGVRLTDDRAATLVPQAEQHFAQLRYLDSIADPSTGPAAELRLDYWTRLDGD